MSASTAESAAPVQAPHRWAALVVIAVAQLMISVDSTIVSIAMPWAQQDLHISDADRQWIVTAYTLAFGGLLLLGGRLGDMIGHRRALLIGLVGFAAASAAGGIAVNADMLLGARALQGAFGALLAPAGLSLITITFTEPAERAKAFGIFSAIAGSGAAVGLILGGVLTEYLTWRWSLLVNVVFAIAVLAGAIPTVRDGAQKRHRGRLDVPGALLATLGAAVLVYGFTRAESDGWLAGPAIALLLGCVLLLTLFVLVERRTAAPLLPLRVVTERNRAGVFASQALAVIAMFGLLLILTYYLQDIRGYTPLQAGVAFLPLVAGMLIGAGQIASRLMTRAAPRWIMAPGFLVAAAGMAMLTTLGVHSSYPLVVLPAEVLLGVGLGMAFTPAMSLATYRIQPQDAGVASAMISASQQLGGSIGTALLNTIATGATATWIAAHGGSSAVADEAAAHGYAVAMRWTVGILVLAAIVVVLAVNTGRLGASDATTTAGATEPNPDLELGRPLPAGEWSPR
jgi:EmrB/QacA subfamily drug resistance transporter